MMAGPSHGNGLPMIQITCADFSVGGFVPQGNRMDIAASISKPSDGAITTAQSSSSQVRRSNKQILQGPIPLIAGDDILQVAARYDTAKIVKLANANRSKVILNNRDVTSRVGQALDAAAQRTGRSPNDLRAELKATRKRNIAQRGRPNHQTRAPTIRVPQDVVMTLDLVDSPMLRHANDVDCNPNPEIGDITQEKRSNGQILQGPIGLIAGDDLLQVAAHYEVDEIIELGNANRSTVILDKPLIQSRIGTALEAVARRTGRSREDLRGELNSARSRNIARRTLGHQHTEATIGNVARDSTMTVLSVTESSAASQDDANSSDPNLGEVKVQASELMDLDAASALLQLSNS